MSAPDEHPETSQRLASVPGVTDKCRSNQVVARNGGGGLPEPVMGEATNPFREVEPTQSRERCRSVAALGRAVWGLDLQ